jgi:SnoaL-like domain
VRRIALALLALPALAACKVERTSDSFYDRRDPAVVERQDAEDEIRARVRNFAEELGRGDTAAAVQALQPVRLAHVIGPDGNRGLVHFGPAGVSAALGPVAGVAPAVARTPDLRVTVELREGVGWFATHLELLPAGPPAREVARLRMTGVFERDRGTWHLVQMHVSAPQAPPPAPADTAAGDSATAGSPGPSPGAGAAPAGAG